jgi:hypothetical protein
MEVWGFGASSLPNESPSRAQIYSKALYMFK